MVNTVLLAFELLFGGWHRNLSRRLRYQDGRMRYALSAERSWLTIALTLGAHCTTEKSWSQRGRLR
jgi:hypothetical protein